MVKFRERFVSCLWALFATYVTALDASLQEVERHLEMGKQFLAKGQFSDALTHYHAAVEIDPENYQTLYRRATCYLAMGKSKSALPDLDKVIVLKPDFSSARLQRASMHFKHGDLDSAQIDYEAVLHKEPENKEALEKLSSMEPMKETVKNANSLFDRGDLIEAERYLTVAVEACPWDAKLREKRALCYESIGEIQKAIADIRSLAKLVPDSTDAYFKISHLYYQTGDTEESLVQIRECLKLNPEHKKCFPHYKKLKKLVKQQETVKSSIQKKEWQNCIDGVKEILKTESNVASIVLETKEYLCKCLSQGGNANDALNMCNEVLAANPNNADVLCDRAEAYIVNEQFEKAVQDYQKAVSMNEEFRRAKEGLNRAQKLLKQSQKKDYYKILGVKRNANKKQIIKAYRKLAQQWHPDNFLPEEKELAQKKFIDIAAAKEVLTDQEKRTRFDNGEDPLDPEAQQQHHQHPFFQGGFNPFGGGGGFKFHFQ